MEENSPSAAAGGMYTLTSASSAQVFNGQVEEENEEGLEFGDDPVYQVLTMMNFSDEPFVPPTTQDLGCQKEDVTYKIDQLNFSKLLNSLGGGDVKTKESKEKEVMEELVRELETERKGREEAEDKLTKMVEFITLVHGEFGKFIKSLISIATKNLEVTNVLNLGPFENESETDEFLGMLEALRDQFLGEFENLGQTKNMMERANRILEASAAALAANVSTEADENSGVSGGESDNDTCSNNQMEEEPSTSSTSEASETAIVAAYSSSSVKTSKRGRGRPRQNLNLPCAKKRHGYDPSKRHRGYFCVCGVRYSSRVSLRAHVKHFTADRKFRCEICNVRFLYACHLRNHMTQRHNLVDLSSAQFSCSKCGEQFETRAELNTHHRRLHVRIGNNNEEHVEKFHGGFGGLRNPERLILGDRHGFDKRSNLNRCLCGAVYSHRTALWSHVTSKLNGKVFKCYLCPKRFDMHATLKLHVRQFHKAEYQQGRYGCPICGKTFPTMDAKNVHRLSEHGLRKKGRHRRNPDSNAELGVTAPEAAGGSISADVPTSYVQPHPILVYVPISTTDADAEDDDVICLD